MPTPLGRFWPLALLAAPLGCTGFLQTDGVSGAPTPPATAGTAGAGAGGTGTTPADAPAQELADLTCQQRYAPVGRIYRLTPEQLQASWQQTYQHPVELSTLPKDGINQVTGFNNDGAASYVTVQLADALFDASKDIASELATTELTARTCLSNTADDACLDAFLGDQALRAFRRPIEAAEGPRYREFFRAQQQAYGTATAVRMTLETFLNAPGFVYRTELGGGTKGDVTLTNHELVSQLSFSMTDAPPSAALLTAAASATALAPAAMRSLAEGLLAQPAAQTKAARFFRQYLQLGSLEVGGVEPDLAAAMLEENAAFIQHVLWNGPGSLTELFTASYTFVDPRLAPLYGVAVTGSGPQRVELNPNERAGFFTQLGFLASRHGPIHRGRVIKEGLLCGTIPAPPPGASAQLEKLAGPDPDATEQERWATFRMDGACGGCHAMFQPLGVAFDNYDELGKYRQVNHAGRGIDTRGAFVAAGELEGEFQDAKAMIALITESTTGRYCFAKRYMSFAHGREVNTAADACALKSVGDHFVASQLSIPELMLAVTEDESFFRRNNVE